MIAQNKISGWLCLDKPAKMSSNSAMCKVRKIFGEKTGYIGTLDPFATGVLPIAIGEARKFIQYVNENKKTYIFTMVFGSTTDTLDIDGTQIATSDIFPSKEQLLELLPSFIGPQKQMPPKFSAIKINGRRACDLVRQGKDVSLNSRDIEIFKLSILDDSSLYTMKEITIEVVCSKGTYVRSIARDIAQKLNSVAYVKLLKRTQSGFFHMNNAIPLEKLQEIDNTTYLASFVLPIASPLDDIPALYVSKDKVRKLQNGLQISLENMNDTEYVSSNVLIFEEYEKSFMGICGLSSDGTLKALRMCSY